MPLKMTDDLPVKVDFGGPDQVWINLGASSICVNAYDAFSIAGRIQATAVRAVLGMTDPATYNQAEIGQLSRIIPDGKESV